MESTTVLLRRIWQGDLRARDQLAKAYLPLLRRLAHGRLPPWVRRFCDTDDVVSTTLAKTFAKIETFKPRREGAFLFYVRRILTNEIRSSIRRAKARPIGEDIDSGLQSKEPSPLEKLLGRELFKRYESALKRLTHKQGEAFVLRFEMGFSYREIAEKLDVTSADAARMTVARAILRLQRDLHDDTTGVG